MLQTGFVEKFKKQIRDAISVVKDNVENEININYFMDTLQAIRDDIKGEYDAIRLYEDHVRMYTQLLQETKNSVYEDLIKITNDIIKEEEAHVGELNELLNKVDPEQMQKFEEGVREAQEKLNGNVQNEQESQTQDSSDILDEQLGGGVYKKLRELGYTPEQWRNFTKEKAQRIIHGNEQPTQQKSTGESSTSSTNSSKTVESEQKSKTNNSGKEEVVEGTKREEKPFNPRKPMERYTNDDGTFDIDLMNKDLEQYISPEIKESYKDMIDTYKKSILEEPKITKNLQDAMSGTGMEFVGFENRVKSPKSFSDKLRGKNPSEHVYDNIRYTLSYKSADDIVNAQKKLQEQGYEVVKQSNYWLNPNSSYKGVNTNVKTPDGNIIEIQYHTPEDLEVKENNHKYYEIQREAIKNGDMTKFIEMDEIMRKNAEKLKEPDNIQSLKSFNTLIN